MLWTISMAVSKQCVDGSRRNVNCDWLIIEKDSINVRRCRKNNNELKRNSLAIDREMQPKNVDGWRGGGDS